MSATLINFAYLVASVLFILGLKGLTHPRTAVRGNLLGALGMLLAVVATLVDQRILSGEYILLGVVVGALIGMILAVKIPLTSMPELVAVFNGLGGGASALVAGAALIEAQAPSYQFTAATAASGIIGAVTFWGSIVAFLKLMEVLKGLVRFPGQQFCNGVLVLGSVGLGAWLVLGE
ncbi:MAG: NAD(P)(+) transhydrogenase (Re/Si-specific) subunit beta, partial [Gemmatimonadetes bacterium]|nr:NAD(P)(+) transhydrogenase (Re/Si-specific) subunit beta [Gemmatimonadota bacterium]